MPQRTFTTFAALFCIFTLLSACTTTPPQTTPVKEGFINCEPPRPQMCTKEYRPVCGHIDTNVRCVTQPCNTSTHKTYGNACGACASEDVIGYEYGSCESFGKGRQ